jgi:hypothetical protein
LAAAAAAGGEEERAALEEEKERARARERVVLCPLLFDVIYTLYITPRAMCASVFELR